MLSSISEGFTRLARACRMTGKVRRDFEIITDVSSRFSQVTTNVRGSSIRSPKSLYKKTGNEILADLKALVKMGALKDPEAPTRHTPVCYDRSSVTGVCQTASSHPQPVTTERKGGEGRNKNELLSCSNHSNKNDCYICFPLTSSLSISFSVDFFLYSSKCWSYGTNIEVFGLRTFNSFSSSEPIQLASNLAVDVTSV